MQSPTKQNNKGTLASLRGLVPDREISSMELPWIAERQAAILRQMLGADEPRFPAEKMMYLPRIKVRYDRSLPASGMTIWDGKYWVILLDPSEPPTRRRFSLLHEFHHIVCHHQQSHMFGTVDQRASDLAERTADYFAGCVLMPRHIVERDWEHGRQDVSAMATRFGVSEKAMKFRLDQLGLVAPKQRCPGSLPVINLSSLIKPYGVAA